MWTSWDPTDNICRRSLEGHRVHSNYQCLNSDLLGRLRVRDQDPERGQTPHCHSARLLSSGAQSQWKETFYQGVSPPSTRRWRAEWSQESKLMWGWCLFFIFFLLSRTRKINKQKANTACSRRSLIKRFFSYGLHSIVTSEQWIQKQTNEKVDIQWHSKIIIHATQMNK